MSSRAAVLWVTRCECENAGAWWRNDKTHHFHKCFQHLNNLRYHVWQMDGFHCKGMIKLSVYYTVSSSCSVKHHSHEVPVQLVRCHLLQQRLETAFEENFEAEVVLDDQGGVQTTVYYLNTRRFRTLQFCGDAAPD